MPKKQILGMVIIIVILSFICMYIYDNFKVEVKTTIIADYTDSNELIDYYKDRNNNNYYLLGLDSIIIDYTDRTLELSRALDTKQIDMDFIFENLTKKYSLEDEKINFYQNSNFSLLECIKADNTKNYIFGQNVMNYNEGLCEDEPYICSFYKKYYVIDVTDSNNNKFKYLTLRDLTNNEVDTVKISVDYLDEMLIGETYVFKFASINSVIDSNIKDIFNNNTVLDMTIDDGLNRNYQNVCK